MGEVLARKFIDVTVWHECRAPRVPRRTIEGGWTTSSSQVWRRKDGIDWVYTQDEKMVCRGA
jgi:hypothetical protein